VMIKTMIDLGLNEDDENVMMKIEEEMVKDDIDDIEKEEKMMIQNDEIETEEGDMKRRMRSGRKGGEGGRRGMIDIGIGLGSLIDLILEKGRRELVVV
jgi:peptidyl-tRNA hydrolase